MLKKIRKKSEKRYKNEKKRKGGRMGRRNVKNDLGGRREGGCT